MFDAILIDKADDAQSVSLTQLDDAALPEGDVTVRIAASTLGASSSAGSVGDMP